MTAFIDLEQCQVFCTCDCVFICCFSVLEECNKKTCDVFVSFLEELTLFTFFFKKCIKHAPSVWIFRWFTPSELTCNKEECTQGLSVKKEICLGTVILYKRWIYIIWVWVDIQVGQHSPWVQHLWILKSVAATHTHTHTQGGPSRPFKSDQSYVLVGFGGSSEAPRGSITCSLYGPQNGC